MKEQGVIAHIFHLSVLNTSSSIFWMVLASNKNFSSPTCQLSISTRKLEGNMHNKIIFNYLTVLQDSTIPVNLRIEALWSPPFWPQSTSKLQPTIAQSNSHLSKHTKRPKTPIRQSKRNYGEMNLAKNTHKLSDIWSYR